MNKLERKFSSLANPFSLAYVFASYAFVAPIPPATSLDSADSDAGGLT